MRPYIAISALSLIIIAVPHACQAQGPTLLPFTTDGESWGYLDDNGKPAIAANYQAALPFSEGLAAVKQGGKYGFIDSSGKFTIPPRFDRAKWFSEGLAPVEMGTSWTFVDKNGVVLDWTFSAADSFSGNLAAVKIGGKYGFIDAHGKPTIAPEFDGPSSFKDGFAPILIAGKYGFVDRSGKVVVPPSYDRVLPFSEGKAAVSLGNKWGYIKNDGTTFQAMRFERAGSFDHGVAYVLDGGKVAHINDSGSVKPADASGPTYKYHIDSSPGGATIYAVPVVKWLAITKHPWTLESLGEFWEGFTAADIDLFDQKYMLVVSIKDDLRTGRIDVLPTATSRALTIKFQ